MCFVTIPACCGDQIGTPHKYRGAQFPGPCVQSPLILLAVHFFLGLSTHKQPFCHPITIILRRLKLLMIPIKKKRMPTMMMMNGMTKKNHCNHHPRLINPLPFWHFPGPLGLSLLCNSINWSINMNNPGSVEANQAFTPPSFTLTKHLPWQTKIITRSS